MQRQRYWVSLSPMLADVSHMTWWTNMMMLRRRFVDKMGGE
jgi:hypothetical protein